MTADRQALTIHSQESVHEHDGNVTHPVAKSIQTAI